MRSTMNLYAPNAPTKRTACWLILPEQAGRGRRLLSGIGLAKKTARCSVSTSSKAAGAACDMVSLCSDTTYYNPYQNRLTVYFGVQMHYCPQTSQYSEAVVAG